MFARHEKKMLDSIINLMVKLQMCDCESEGIRVAAAEADRNLRIIAHREALSFDDRFPEIDDDPPCEET